jgi:protein-L-isoaspartate(D-aspartate) O-methyltransferase
MGWPEAGPFNGIISTAAPREVPALLKEQLAPDGVLVIPVGSETQELQMIIREGDSNHFITQVIESVKFVPLLPGVTR